MTNPRRDFYEPDGPPVDECPHCDEPWSAEWADVVNGPRCPGCGWWVAEGVEDD